MPIRVYKTLTGAYKETDENDYDALVVSPHEWNAQIDKISRLQIKLTDVEREAKTAIRNADGRAEYAIRQAQADAADQIRMNDEKLFELQHQVKVLDNLNKELKRIAIERANKDRNIRPKKQRSGYVLQNCDQFIKRVAVAKGKKPIDAVFWRLKLQTPYSAKMSYESFQACFDKDLDSFLFEKLKIETIYASLPDNWQDRNDNYGFDMLYKLNGPRGYWEVEICFGLPVDIDADFLPEK